MVTLYGVHGDLVQFRQGWTSPSPDGMRNLFHVAANRQGVAALRPSCCQHLPAVLGSHPLAEPVLVPPLPVMRLKCPLHSLKLLSYGLLKIQDSKSINFLRQ